MSETLTDRLEDFVEDIAENVQDRVEDVFEEMERRNKLIDIKATSVEQSESMPLVKAGFGLTAYRMALWTVASTKLTALVMYDKARKQYTPKQNGIRLREMLLGMGATAVKMGQQLAIRTDILHPEICRELDEMLDGVPPFPFEHAQKRIELAIKAPLYEVFQKFDREPIGSASIACVYQAVLKNGERVAVKVRRPGVERYFKADLTALNFTLSMLELGTFVRPGFFKNLKTELTNMFMEEMDFMQEARYQWLFRRQTKKDKIKWLTAPKVYREYCSYDVIVSEFVEGIPSLEVIAAKESGDPAAMAELKRMKIDPVKLGKRIMYLQWWSQEEGLFFHGDPHPGNIIIQPNNRIVMIDFGACGTVSKRIRTCMRRSLVSFANLDVEANVSAAISMLEPIPPINIEEFRKVLEEKTWKRVFVFKDKKAPWYERTSGRMWAGLMDSTREFQIPVNIDTLRLMRSTLLYDSVACRLWPDFKPAKAYQKYRNEALKREARRLRKRLKKSSTPRSARVSYYKSQLAASAAADTAAMLEETLMQAPMKFGAVKAQIAVIVAAFFQVITTAGLLLALVGVPMIIHDYWTGESLSIHGVAAELLAHPIYDIVVAFVLFLSMRRVAFRLSDFKTPGE